MRERSQVTEGARAETGSGFVSASVPAAINVPQAMIVATMGSEAPPWNRNPAMTGPSAAPPRPP